MRPLASICLCALLIGAGAAQAQPAGAQVTYYGGPVVSNVKSYVVLWGGSGADYLSQAFSGTSNIASFLNNAFAPTFYDWLSEYSTAGVIAANGSPGTNQNIGHGSFAGFLTITPSSANNGPTVDDTQVQSELDAQILAGHLPAPDSNTVYIVYFPHGTAITRGGAKSCMAGGFCAYHRARVSSAISSNGGHYLYAVMPDMQAGSGCETGCGNASTPFGNYTSALTHVLGGIITDPNKSLATGLAPPLAWYDSNNGEIGDICNGQQALVTGTDSQTYTVQLLWSNASGACIARDVNAFGLGASPTTITIAPGGSGNSTISTATVRGVNQTIALSISGVPAEVSASFSASMLTSGDSSTLTLSSTANVAPGTYHLTVTGTELGTSHSHTSLVTLVVLGPRPSTLTLTGPSSIPFGACSAMYPAVLTDSLSSAPLAGQTIAFQVGTQTGNATTDATGTATFGVALSQGLGHISATAAYAGTVNQAGATAKPLTVAIAAGQANVVYTGSTFLWASSPSSSKGSLTLSGTTQDVAGVSCGDIRSATMSFGFRNPDNSITPIAGAQNLPVGLVSPTDTTTGVASAIVSYNPAGFPAHGLPIAITLGGNYAVAKELDTTIIQLASPGPVRLLTAAGAVNLPASPAGAGFLDSKTGAVASGPAGYMLVDAAVEWKKGQANPEGFAALVVTTFDKPDGTLDTTQHRYAITCISLDSLTAPVPGSMIQVTGKAEVWDATNLLAPVLVDGAATLELTTTNPTTVYPNGEVNALVIGSKNNLWIAGGWNGTQPANKPLATGTVLGK